MKYSLWLFLFSIQSLFAEWPSSLAEPLENSDQNWVLSPFSIRTCLSMAALGAQGETAEEMCTVLSLGQGFEEEFAQTRNLLERDGSSEKDFQLHIAQGVWVRQDFSLLPSFSLLLQNAFRAVVERVSFSPATVAQINRWVSEKTKQKIENLLPSSALNSSASLVLTNALYFQGSWSRPFSPSLTRPLPFYPGVGPSQDVLTMEQKGSFPYYEDAQVQAVALPFFRSSPEGAEPLCLLILPRQGERFSLDRCGDIVHSLETHPVKIQVPKFQAETALELSESLQQMGMRRAFSPAADFSGIDGRGALCIGAVFHKAFFSFEEAGVEAAAGTACAICTTTSLPSDKKRVFFSANRPFYFLLLDRKSEELLFVGRIEHPNG